LDYKWDKGFSYTEKYIQEHGHANVPRKYKTPDGFSLGSWVNNQRSTKLRLTNDKISRLESLEGWAWSMLELKWNQGFNYFKKHIKENGCESIPRAYIAADGFRLGSWLGYQKDHYKELTVDQQQRLESLKLQED